MSRSYRFRDDHGVPRAGVAAGVGAGRTPGPAAGRSPVGNAQPCCVRRTVPKRRSTTPTGAQTTITSPPGPGLRREPAAGGLQAPPARKIAGWERTAVLRAAERSRTAINHSYRCPNDDHRSPGAGVAAEPALGDPGPAGGKIASRERAAVVRAADRSRTAINHSHRCPNNDHRPRAGPRTGAGARARSPSRSAGRPPRFGRPVDNLVPLWTTDSDRLAHHKPPTRGRGRGRSGAGRAGRGGAGAGGTGAAERGGAGWREGRQGPRSSSRWGLVRRRSGSRRSRTRRKSGRWG